MIGILKSKLGSIPYHSKEPALEHVFKSSLEMLSQSSDFNNQVTRMNCLIIFPTRMELEEGKEKDVSFM